MAIQRSDLEAKLREIEEIVEETKAHTKTTGTVAAIGVVVLVAVIFLLGRRRGKNRGKARVEIYRL